ncbi:nephrin-like [Osmerus eperlanus]|uniref:nephrin-like n=1 Tax=Osmerus eperlanus TaxID=29151 RepID=UPI002E143BD6
MRFASDAAIGSQEVKTRTHPPRCWGGGGPLSVGASLKEMRVQALGSEAGAQQAQQAFRTQPRNLTVRAGATAVLRCEVLRPSGPVQWVKDGLLLGPRRELPGFPRYRMIGDPRRGQYHLQIDKAELEDDSPYECQVGQSESSKAIISHTVWITVQSEQNHGAGP